ncbi:MAG TPA: hypothetical protein EYG16_00095 [Deltaproteobacteria bacterium]|nr:hypothetical protein [Deltaproteobacteria bacterium]
MSRDLISVELGSVSGYEAWRAELLAATLAADLGCAWLLTWTRSEQGVSLGRFHRRAEGAESIERRLTGGRNVPAGPAVQEFAFVLPSVDWLDEGAGGLGPGQVLNRALRPLLACLRAELSSRSGLEPFYPGRDLVTVDSRPVAHAAYSVFADGVCVVEQMLFTAEAPGVVDSLLELLDPAGITGQALGGLDAGCSLAQLGVDQQIDWARLMALESASVFACKLSPGSLPGQGLTADASAWDCFQRERGSLAAGRLLAAGPSMLGMLECSGVGPGTEGDVSLSGIEICGDLLAPFHLIDQVEQALEGCPPVVSEIASRIEQLTSSTGGFILGCDNSGEHALAALLARCA